jgi:hypothetical protein
MQPAGPERVPHVANKFAPPYGSLSGLNLIGSLLDWLPRKVKAARAWRSLRALRAEGHLGFEVDTLILFNIAYVSLDHIQITLVIDLRLTQ